jgi:hypothetical protein
MFDPHLIILYVNNPINSTIFYEKILGNPPVEYKPTFSLFALASGIMLGLWSRHTVQPSINVAGGASELALSVPDQYTVDAMHADWSKQGITIAQFPTTMELGYTFVALDLDGHRLRIFAPKRA